MVRVLRDQSWVVCQVNTEREESDLQTSGLIYFSYQSLLIDLSVGQRDAESGKMT